MKLRVKGIMLFAWMLISPMLFASGITFQKLSLEQALTKAKTEKKFVFIDVYATWCGPCKYLASNIFTDPTLGKYMDQHYVSIQLDGEQGDGLGLMYTHQLDAFPTMLFMTPDGALQKKIVGVVSAEEIQSKAQGVRFPETTEIYQLTKRYDAGERTQPFLQDYIMALIDEQKDALPVAEDYLKRYPSLDLENENEFVVFLVAVDERDHPLTKQFMNNADKLTDLYGELAGTKMEMILFKLVQDAVSVNNEQIIKTELPTIYTAYKKVFGENSLDQPELERILTNYYAQGVEN
jgi:thiol-disulfide isomerase/thioredoxin